MFTPASRGKQSSSLLHSLPIPAVNVAPLPAFCMGKPLCFLLFVGYCINGSSFRRIQVRFGLHGLAAILWHYNYLPAFCFEMH